MAGTQIKSRVIALTTVIIAVALITSCFDGNSSLAYVPANSAAVVVVDWKSAAADPGLKRMINGDELESQLGKLGIRSEAVNEWVVFATLGSESGLVIRGDFDSSELEQRLVSAGWIAGDMNGTTVYSRASDVVWLASDGLIVAGPRAGVNASMKTAAQSRESIESVENFQNVRGQLATDSKPVVGYLIAPKGTLEAADTALKVTSSAMSLFGMGEIGTILSKINIASGVGTAIGKSELNSKFSVDFCVLMRDEGTATVVAGALNAMKSLSSYVGSPAEKENLESFEVFQQDLTLTIRMEMPAAPLMPPR